MTKPRKHNDCKFYGYRSCAHANDETMKRATQDFSEHCGSGSYPTMQPFPSPEEIDAICQGCNEFIPVRKKK